jgi:hypothetical protein
MHTSKFSWADLLTVLGATVFGFFCFLSFNFLSLGETMPGIVKALVYALILGGLAFGAKLLKRANRNFKNCIIWEWVLLLLFVAAAFFAVSKFSHYFAVLDQKTEIETKVTANIVQAENMFTAYEEYVKNRKNIYKNRLNSVAAAKGISPNEYSQYGFVDGTSDEEQIKHKMFALHAKLIPSNYEGKKGMKTVAIEWLVSAKNTVKSKLTFTFGIVKVITKLQTNINDWKNKLVSNSAFRAEGEPQQEFEYALNLNDVTDKFTKPGRPTSLSIAIAMGLYLLMLLPYIVARRSTKNHYSLFHLSKRKRNNKGNDIDIEY